MPRSRRRTSKGSLSTISSADVQDALARGHRIKMVCEAWREDGHVIGRVASREIPLAALFALVEATGSILRFTTDIAGKIVLAEEDSDLLTTAYGVISNLYRLR
jgi:homoserine dehydrogenase